MTCNTTNGIELPEDPCEAVRYLEGLLVGAASGTSKKVIRHGQNWVERQEANPKVLLALLEQYRARCGDPKRGGYSPRYAGRVGPMTIHTGSTRPNIPRHRR